MIAVGAAAVLLVGLIVARGDRGFPGDDLFVGDPTTTLGPSPGPAGAANVEDTDGTAVDGAPPIMFTSPRPGVDDRELIVFVPLEIAAIKGVSCSTGLAADVRTTAMEVVVTVRPSTTPSTNPCRAGVDQIALRVALPEPLGRRFVTDGSQFPDGYGAPYGGSALLVPTDLPDGFTAQEEQDVYGWEVCYAATRDACALGQGPLVRTTMAGGAGQIAKQLGLPDELGRAGSAQASEPDPGSWIRDGWPIGAVVRWTITGRTSVGGSPAMVLHDPTSGERAVIWSTTITALVPWMQRPENGPPTSQVFEYTGTSWHTLRVSAETSLDDDQLVALAESMQPAG